MISLFHLQVLDVTLIHEPVSMHRARTYREGCPQDPVSFTVDIEEARALFPQPQIMVPMDSPMLLFILIHHTDKQLGGSC